MPSYQDLEALQVQLNAALTKGMKSVINPVSNLITAEFAMKTETAIAPIAKTVGPWREWTGARQVEVDYPASSVVVAKGYEKTIGVKRIKVDTDQTATEMFRFEDLGRKAASFQDELVAAKLMAGTSDTGYDGVSFFNATHPADDGAAAYSNMSGSGTAPWYVFALDSMKPMLFGVLRKPEIVHLWDPSHPDVFHRDEYISGASAYGAATFGMPQAAYRCAGALNTTNFELAMTSIMARTDTRGQSLGLGSDLLVVVPTILVPDAKRLFGREYLAGGEQNVNNGYRWVPWSRIANS